MTIRTILAAVTLPLVALPAIVHAQDAAAEEPSGPITIEGEIGAFSDYRFRGLSLSGKEPEITASLTVSHESGLYANAWLSNVELGNGKADNLEMDWTVGYSRDVGAINLDVGAIYYSYLNYSNLNYWEFFGSAGTAVGPGEVRVGVAYAPSQGNIGSVDNTYVYISGETPLGDTPLTLSGRFGWEDGAFGNKKLDWTVGLDYDLGRGFTLGVAYVDTRRSFSPNGDPTAVASLRWGF